VFNGAQNSIERPNEMGNRGINQVNAIEILREKINQNESLQAKLKRQIELQENRILILEHQTRHYKQEYNNARGCIESARSNQNNLDLMTILYHSNSNLTKKLSNALDYRKDINMIDSQDMGPSIGEAAMGINCVEGGIADTVASIKGLERPFSRQYENTPKRNTLQQLLHQICDMKLENLQVFSTQKRLEKIHILQGVVGAHICQLAFESEFPDTLNSESILLDKYRENILIKGLISPPPPCHSFFALKGPKKWRENITGIVAKIKLDGHQGLRNLDLIVHKSLLAEPYFETNILLPKAKRLSMEVADLIDLLLGEQVGKTNAIARQYAEDNHVRNDAVDFLPDISLTELLQGVILEALKLKMNLLLRQTWRYEFVFFPPESEFQPETMRIEGQYFPQVHPKLENGESSQPQVRIKLCIFPALYAYEQPAQNEALTEADDISELLTTYKIFLPSKKVPPPQQPGRVTFISKAVVIV
jgi:hypothetical protein